MSEDRFDQIRIGEEAEISHTITSEDVDSFVKLTGDNNPLHVDDRYAETTLLKKRVVHGMLTASFISTIIGTKLPGKGALWYEQQIRFLTPVRIGEKIRVWVKVIHKSKTHRILVLNTIVFGDQKRRIIEGEAKVKILKSEIIEKGAEVPDFEKGAVIVTGASGGIGSSIANELSQIGHPVVINYLNSETQAKKILNKIKNNKGNAIIYRADVSDSQAVQEMVEKSILKFKSVTGIVNCASGFIETLPFSQLQWDAFHRHMEVQIKGAFNLSKALIPHLCARKKGVIVNIGSIVADNVPPINMIPYTISKSALITFTRCLATEYGPKGIRVNCVSPGMTNTDLIADFPENIKMVTKMKTPLRRLAIPNDIAGLVAFLFTDKATFITGQNIRVCGGMVMA